jgi:hypothetical protein
MPIIDKPKRHDMKEADRNDRFFFFFLSGLLAFSRELRETVINQVSYMA